MGDSVALHPRVLAIVTHPRIFEPPTALPRALDQVEAWLESPNLMLLAEADEHWSRLRALVQTGRAGRRCTTPEWRGFASRTAYVNFGR